MKARRYAAVLASAAMVTMMASAALGAHAEEPAYSTTLATDAELTSVTLDKYLVMDKDANVPVSVFTFTVESGTETAADTESGRLAVKSFAKLPALSIGGGSPKNGGSINMTFSPSDETVAEASAGTDSPTFVTPADSNDEKYVKKTLTLDFSGVTFPEPAVYRYIITESGSNQGVTNGYAAADAPETARTLDVYVVNADTTDPVTDQPQLKIAGYAMYKGRQSGAPSSTAADEGETPNGAEVEGTVKSRSLTNAYATHDLTFGKVVKGNQGSKDKYFRYTVEIGGIVAAGTALSADLSRADSAVPAAPNPATKADYAGRANPAELVAYTTATLADNGYTVEPDDSGESYTITAEYYLQHGQYITIKGLPEGATYTITESREDYTSADGISAADSTLDWDGADGYDALSDDVSGTVADADIHTGFTNELSGIIPTGVLTTEAGAFGLFALGICGALGGAVYLRKKKANEK
ncbi:MAG: hypothetical protein Q4A05_06190 [Ruminococcus sp.]|nr:hypothetical protein [Ruminococcus sp.]